MSRLLELYNDTLKSELKTKLSLNNIYQVPKLQKIVLVLLSLFYLV